MAATQHSNAQFAQQLTDPPSLQIMVLNLVWDNLFMTFWPRWSQGT